MKTITRLIALALTFGFTAPQAVNAQSAITAPSGTVVTANTTSGTAMGNPGGKTFTYTNPNWANFESPCVLWGVPDTLTSIINGNNSLPPNQTCTGLSDLIYNSAQSNLSGGIAIFTGTTNYYYINGAGSYITNSLSVRLTLTVTDTLNNALNLIHNSNKLLIKVTDNFKANILLATYAPSYAMYTGANQGNTWVPSITLYDVLHTNPNRSICTSFDEFSFYDLTVNGTASSTSPYCVGQTIQLSASGGSSYSWTGPAGFSSSTQNPSIASATTAQDSAFIVSIYEPIYSCPDIDTVNVTVNPLPTIGTSASNNPLCLNDTLSLTASGANTYSWSGGITNGVSFSPSASSTYTVTGTDVNGCQNTASIGVTVNPLPTATVQASSDTICIGSSVTIWGDPSLTNVWSNGVTDSVTFTPSGSATYNITSTDNNGCSASNSIYVHTRSLPTVVAGASSTSICAGDNVTLTASGASTLTWSNGFLSNVPFAPSATASYYLTGTDINGCVNYDTVQIVVNSLPNATATTTADTVCAGTAITLTGNASTTNMWSSGVSDGVAFTPSASNTYTVTSTDGNSCSDTASVYVHVNNLPNVVGTASSSAVCDGDNVTLSGSGAVSYSWSNGVSDGVSFVPSATSDYYVTGTDANSCSNMDTVTVTVNPLPNPTINASDDSICVGSSVTLSGNSSYTNTWSNGVVDGVAFTPLNSGTYTITSTDANNCSDTNSIFILVYDLPMVVANASSDTICFGDSITLSGSGADVYTWANGVVGNTPFAPTATTSYYLTGVDNSGCTNYDTVTVQVNSLPNVVATTSADTICLGESVTLSGNGADQYTWTNGVLDNTAFAPSESATYHVVGIDSEGCSNSDSIDVVVNDLPIVNIGNDTMICQYRKVTLDAGSGFASYGWSSGDATSTIEVDGFALGAGSFDYSVTVTDENTCSSADTITITFTECVGIEEIETLEAKAYPNPTSGDLTIETSTELDGFEVEVYNLAGERVYIRSVENNSGRLVIPMAHLPSGVYMIAIRSDQQTKTLRIVRE